MKSQTRFSGARWDRIFGTLLVLVILIVLLVSGIRSCMRKDGDPAADENTSQSETSPGATSAESTQVYLSPSAETAAIAGSIRDALTEKGYTVTVAGQSDNLQTRVEQSAALGCTAYVALQTDAERSGYAFYYHSSIEGSKALTEAVSDSLSGGELLDEKQRDLYEVSQNSCAVCVIVLPGSGETEFAQSAAKGIAAYLEGGDNRA